METENNWNVVILVNILHRAPYGWVGGKLRLAYGNIIIQSPIILIEADRV